MTVPPRWMKRLAAGTARLRALDPAASRYGVFPGGDGRRRPVARAAAASVKEARAAGWITAAGHDFVLTPEGRAALTAMPGATNYADRHRVMEDVPVMVDGQITTARRNLNESPLARWGRPQAGSRAPFLDAAELAAGERFREDYARSTLPARVTAIWSGQPGLPGGRPRDAADAPLAAIAAKDRVFAAFDALGPGLDRVILAVCIREQAMDGVERDLGWPHRSGKLALKLALQRLARHYGLVQADRASGRRGTGLGLDTGDHGVQPVGPLG